jgi:hypothetical protein
MPVMQQNPDGSWSPAEPLPYIGWKARLADKLRRAKWTRGHTGIARLLERWDERGLGR